MLHSHFEILYCLSENMPWFVQKIQSGNFLGKLNILSCVTQFDYHFDCSLIDFSVNSDEALICENSHS